MQRITTSTNMASLPVKAHAARSLRHTLSPVAPRPSLNRHTVLQSRLDSTPHTGRHLVARRHVAARCSVGSFPEFLPAEMEEITEPAAREMAARMRRVPIEVSSRSTSVFTSCVGPSSEKEKTYDPFVLLHGFDSSCLEFRRLYPLLDEHGDTWAPDLMGWGFTDAGEGTYSPEDKREHLYNFWKSEIGRPMNLVGVSLGGAAAIDFAIQHPAAVNKLVLVDSQGFIDGLGPMSIMPDALKFAGINILKSVALRQMANKMAYYDVPTYATDDACKIGRLHTFLPGWADANVQWMNSGGYSLSKRIKEVNVDTMIMWGRQDEILDPSYADRFLQELPNARMEWIDECGHCAHLEQPHAMLELLLDFCDKKQ